MPSTVTPSTVTTPTYKFHERQQRMKKRVLEEDQDSTASQHNESSCSVGIATPANAAAGTTREDTIQGGADGSTWNTGSFVPNDAN